MTETEAETFAARMKRIWEPEQDFCPRRYIPDNWEFRQSLGEDGFLSIQEQGLESIFVLYLDNPAQQSQATLGCRIGADVRVLATSQPAPSLLKWLPVFRRGCWLSGCDIEATMHEKMEWIQGFAEEEVEA